jgi:cardiolipin synthase C
MVSVRIAVLFFALTLAACGALPPRGDPPQSQALAASPDSALARIASQSVPDPSQTGFRLMPHGIYALDARIELIERARHTLDVQYYLIANDRTGRLFMRRLREAALRGVRVRLLVDDLYTAGADPMFAGLAAFENVQVRLFNPFCCARESVASRFAASLADFGRVNHRMHNKLLIADGAIAVMGGRNIADEYFARATASNFVDMDVLVAGNVVPQLAAIFDTYWNSRAAYPIETILGAPADRDDVQRRFDRLVDEGDQMMAVAQPPVDMLGQHPLREEFDSGHLPLALGRGVAFADQPAKVMATSMEMAQAMTVQMNVMDRVALATREVVISSPYFVPGTSGVQAFEELRKRGVNVVVLTNSLASNDVPVTYLGYARYRPSLVRAGVELYELNGAGLKGGVWDFLPGQSHGRLHAKAAVLDGAVVYVGSMNLDPRSENFNTELGVVAQCPELAQAVTRVIEVTLRRSAYRLRYAADGQLQWVGVNEGSEVVLTSEPDVSPLMNFRDMLLGPFVPERLL